MITDDGSDGSGRKNRRENELPKLRVALEFRTVEVLENLAGGVVE